jgi:hypothetical protein
MSGNFKYGAVVAWDGFKFAGGGASDKLLVILGAKQGKEIIAVLATSKQHGKRADPGCHAKDGYYFIPAKTASFPKDTWLELYRPQEIAPAELVKVSLKKEARVTDNLTSQMANAIRNCLKQCPDVTGHQLTLLE